MANLTPPKPPLERFLAKTVVQPNGCWEWVGARQPNGYGRFFFGGKRIGFAHRFAYETAYGTIPDGLVVDHICKRRSCVNPSHMRVMTQRENMLLSLNPEGLKRSNETRTMKRDCPRGHQYDLFNTYIDPKGKRFCRTCNRESKAQRRSQQ